MGSYCPSEAISSLFCTELWRSFRFSPVVSPPKASHRMSHTRSSSISRPLSTKTTAKTPQGFGTRMLPLPIYPSSICFHLCQMPSLNPPQPTNKQKQTPLTSKRKLKKKPSNETTLASPKETPPHLSAPGTAGFSGVAQVEAHLVAWLCFGKKPSVAKKSGLQLLHLIKFRAMKFSEIRFEVSFFVLPAMKL